MTRLATALRLELRIELRYHIVAVAGALTAMWMVALLARGVGPFVPLVDTATFGALFIAALVLFERGEGALAALSVSPLRFGEYLAVKITTLTALSMASAIRSRGPQHAGPPGWDWSCSPWPWSPPSS